LSISSKDPCYKPTVGEGGGDIDGLGPWAIYDSDGETLGAAGIRPTDNRRAQSIFNQNTSVACSVGNQPVLIWKVWGGY
jgi:hypothetical protein